MFIPYCLFLLWILVLYLFTGLARLHVCMCAISYRPRLYWVVARGGHSTGRYAFHHKYKKTLKPQIYTINWLLWCGSGKTAQVASLRHHLEWEQRERGGYRNRLVFYSSSWEASLYEGLRSTVCGKYQKDCTAGKMHIWLECIWERCEVVRIYNFPIIIPCILSQLFSCSLVCINMVHVLDLI